MNTPIKKTHYTLAESQTFGWPGLKGYAINSKEDFADASTAVIEIEGSHGLTKNVGSILIYFVIEGTCTFTVDGKTISVKKDDVVIVPKNTSFDYQGHCRLFLVTMPAYDPVDDVRI